MISYKEFLDKMETETYKKCRTNRKGITTKCKKIKVKWGRLKPPPCSLPCPTPLK